ncbi:hypothetical protein P3T36_004835 [Kitasatospora sp. MAP12-15]|uniref:hypothetical protein n=1 Tax=unclassified Kitasatospora TaxID=2633591 RepID=UPI00247698BB|nr:hypothetical protein [Kitasatospora sp. MAP12-44]MDH6110233.1 hypothetical protein [Kitasatospora sp. MAP12-44]
MSITYLTSEPRPANVSEWHWWWQEAVESDRRHRRYGDHVPDAVTFDGIVVEFQRSSISAGDIKERELHYNGMAWLFDARQAHAEGRLRVALPDSEAPVPYRWRQAPNYLKQCRRPVFLDLGESSTFGGVHLLYRLPELYARGSGLGHLYTAENVRNWMAYGVELTPWVPTTSQKRQIGIQRQPA